MKPFEEYPEGKVIELNDSNHNLRAHVPIILFRNEYIQEIVSILTDTSSQIKFVKLYGEPGTGKSSIAHVAINYVLERKFFKDGVIIVSADSKVPFLE